LFELLQATHTAHIAQVSLDVSQWKQATAAAKQEVYHVHSSQNTILEDKLRQATQKMTEMERALQSLVAENKRLMQSRQELSQDYEDLLQKAVHLETFRKVIHSSKS
jgi:hypothetical protein